MKVNQSLFNAIKNSAKGVVPAGIKVAKAATPVAFSSGLKAAAKSQKSRPSVTPAFKAMTKMPKFPKK